MRYVVTAYGENTTAPTTEVVGDNAELMLTVCERYAADANNMAHGIYVWDWNELSLSEFVQHGEFVGTFRVISK